MLSALCVVFCDFRLHVIRVQYGHWLGVLGRVGRIITVSCQHKGQCTQRYQVVPVSPHNCTSFRGVYVVVRWACFIKGASK